jgi:hypothetical protein
MRHGDSLIGKRNSEHENEQLSDQHIRLGENSERAQRVNAFVKAGGHESKAEVVSVNDLFIESAFSQG